MDAVAYQMSFDNEQLALLCANYDRCIDSLGAENKRLKAENAKLRELIANVHEALCADKAGMFNELTLASMEDDMRELGVTE